MFWNRKKERQIAELRPREETGLSFRRRIWRRFKSRRRAMWSLRIAVFLILIALFADFLSNDKPLYCQLEGKTYFPIFKEYAVSLGWGQWEARFINEGWREQNYDRVVWPLVPYSGATMDLKNRNYRSPFGAQEVDSPRFRHWLGTDRLGRDVLAGMIRGTRVAMLVGVVAMSIALIIGVFLGALAGYFGDHGIRLSWTRLILNTLGLILGVFYGFSARDYALSEGVWLIEVIKGLLILSLILGIFNLLARLLERWPVLNKKTDFPADLLIMRLIETVNAIPGLLLILAIVAVANKPSIFLVMAVIGLIQWTSIARFTRAEILRIRNMEYVQAARVLGLKHWQIIWRHVLPNALTPILIVLAFGIANAVLLEAFLSFLNIGMPLESISWGSMLNAAQSRFSAWWLAVFPGLAIFVTVTVFNLMGDGLTEALDTRSQERG